MKDPVAGAFVAKRLVLLGGGHSHLAVLKSFGMAPLPGVQVTLVTKEVHAPYSGMLPGYVAGYYDFDDCHVDLTKLATFASARLVHAAACGVDTAANEVLFADRPALPYDCLSVDIGITPDLDTVPGAREHVTPVKPISEFIARVDKLLHRMKSRDGVGRVVVVGGGAGGVEIAFALHHRLAADKALGQESTVTLISRDRILASHPPRARALFLDLARDRGIQVVEGAGVAQVSQGALRLSSGQVVPFDECLWCTAAAPAAWLQQVDLPKAQKGFLAIDEFLRSAGGSGNVFACGDVATSVCDPRPKAGVFAVRQGPPLADNLRRFLTGRPLRAFRPQTSFLSLISTGDRSAVATNFGLALSGGWLWTWKDRIDRAFMYKFGRDLPEMSANVEPAPDVVNQAGADAVAEWAAARMRCGGCAAKVSAPVLRRALSRLPAATSPHVISGVSSADDAAVTRAPPPGSVLVQTVDFFRAFTSDPYVFGRIAANHALSDCFAMGAAPTSALAIAVVPYAVEAAMEDALYQMMSGANAVLSDAGCALVGGHSCEGGELALGFSVTGHAEEARLMTKGGLAAGDALVLTKPLGTGVLLKGEMTLRAKGRWVAAALAAMQVSNSHAAQVALQHDVRACTDVTGFGLLGHLAEMAAASGVHVELDVRAVPFWEGAEEVLQLGVRSSLHDQNSRAAVHVTNHAEALRLPTWPLLVDPQTAGGLLLGLPSERAAGFVKALQAAGVSDAVVIGRVLSRQAAGVESQQCITCRL